MLQQESVAGVASGMADFFGYMEQMSHMSVE
jgi:hypothetical protein